MTNPVSDVMERLRQREQDPEWLAQQRQAAERREAEYRRALISAQTTAAAKLGIPLKDLELLRGDEARDTPAVLATQQPSVVTVLSGGPGTGKTMASSLWLYRWVHDSANWTGFDEFTPPKLRGSAVFVTAPRLARWDRYDNREMEVLFRATRLVIDDLGVEFMDAKGAYLSLFDELFNERYAQKRPTVLTTNLTVEEFRNRYCERIADRIRESGRFVSLKSESMRGKGPTDQVALPRLSAVPDRETGADDDEREPAYDGWRKSR